ncbi:hypothetical protein ABZY93_21000 [Streptomyces smyrnaeus]
MLRRTHGAKRCHHPLVGDLHFSHESFQTPGDTDTGPVRRQRRTGLRDRPGSRGPGRWTAPESTSPDASRAS